MRKYFMFALTMFILFFGFCISARAEGNVSASFAGKSNQPVGSEITLDLTINSVAGSSDGKLYAFGGYVIYDPEYLEFVSYTGANGWVGQFNSVGDQKIKISTIDFTMSKGVSSGVIGKITFRTLKLGYTYVKMDTIDATDQVKNLDTYFGDKLINIINPNDTSANDYTNLKSLNVAGYLLSTTFSPNTKEYSVNVPKTETCVNISAVANDPNAFVLGGGLIRLVSDSTIANIVVINDSNVIAVYDITINKVPVELSTNVLVSGITNRGYTGKAIIQPTMQLTYKGVVLKLGKDYNVSYINNKNIGTATMIIKGIGNYKGELVRLFKIVKGTNPLTIANKNVTIKQSKVKKAKQVVMPLTITNKQGTLAFTKLKGSSSKLRINKTTGKVTIKKGTKKGIYKMIVKVYASGNKNYNALAKIVTVKIRVK